MNLEAFSALDRPIGDRKPLPGLKIAGLTLTELSDTGGVMCTAATAAGDVADLLSGAVGCPLPSAHGAITTAPSRQAIWMSPRSWLVLCPLSEEFQIVETVRQAFPDHLAHGAPFSDYLGWYSLVGNDAEAALRQGSFLTFAAEGFKTGHAKRTQLAGIPAVLVRDRVESWRIGIERSRAAYLLNWFQGLTL